MIKLILGNAVLNEISSKLLSGNSRIVKPVFVLLLITLSLLLLGVYQVVRFCNPRRMIYLKKDRLTQYKTA
jgi:hypothetical protein